MRGMKRLTGLGALLALVAIGLLAAGAGSAVPEARAKPKALKKFSTCGELLDYAKRNTRRIVGPFGVPGVFAGREAAPPATPVSDQNAAAGRNAPSSAADFSTTNVQEEGVDEPDVVKTNGK